MSPKSLMASMLLCFTAAISYKWNMLPSFTTILKKFFNVLFIFERERQCMSRGGPEREGDTESEAGPRLSCHHIAWRGARTHELWEYDLSWCWMLNQVSHPGTPTFLLPTWPSKFRWCISSSRKSSLTATAWFSCPSLGFYNNLYIY